MWCVCVTIVTSCEHCDIVWKYLTIMSTCENFDHLQRIWQHLLRRPRCLEPCIKVMRKRPKMSANDISGLLAYTMELFVLYKIEVVAAPMVRSELRYWAFPDGLFTWISDWILAENSNPKQARHIFPEIWILSAILVKQRKFNLPGKSAWLAWDLNFPPKLMSFQSDIQVKSGIVAFFNSKYHPSGLRPLGSFGDPRPASFQESLRKRRNFGPVLRGCTLGPLCHIPCHIKSTQVDYLELWGFWNLLHLGHICFESIFRTQCTG